MPRVFCDVAIRRARLATVSPGRPTPPLRGPPKFPCVDAHAAREERILSKTSSLTSPSPSRDPSQSGPEPPYARPSPTSYQLYHHAKPFSLIYSPTPLAQFTLAYETWGTLNSTKSNAILLHTGLSASSHAASTRLNSSPGWWEKFIGPGKALDTNQFFVICTNVLGGCYGSTGPSSLNPMAGDQAGTSRVYGTNFPVLSIWDMIRAQWHLVDHLGIDKLYASIGSSMGGMTSLAAAWLHPHRVGKVASISGTARSSPSAIAMRYAQRSVLMADPNWNRGFYYDGLPPHTGMKLARQIATITYRSGPEWDQRFGRQLREPSPEQLSQVEETGKPRAPMFCPDFLIETYLDHQGEQFCLKYDANSLIYISKAMDLFDMTQPALDGLGIQPSNSSKPSSSSSPQPQPQPHATRSPKHAPTQHQHESTSPPPRTSYLPSLAAGLSPLAQTPTLVLGVQSDILLPVEQQRELARALKMAGNERVSYYELGGVWGHDTFLLDVGNVGGALRGFLSLN